MLLVKAGQLLCLAVSSISKGTNARAIGSHGAGVDNGQLQQRAITTITTPSASSSAVVLPQHSCITQEDKQVISGVAPGGAISRLQIGTGQATYRWKKGVLRWAVDPGNGFQGFGNSETIALVTKYASEAAEVWNTALQGTGLSFQQVNRDDNPHFMIVYGDYCTLNPYVSQCSDHTPVLAHSFFPNNGICNAIVLYQWYFTYIGQYQFWNNAMIHEFGHILGFRHEQGDPNSFPAVRLTPYADPQSVMSYNSDMYFTETDRHDANVYYSLTDDQASAVGVKVISIAPSYYSISQCNYGDQF